MVMLTTYFAPYVFNNWLIQIVHIASCCLCRYVLFQFNFQWHLTRVVVEQCSAKIWGFCTLHEYTDLMQYVTL